MYAILVEEPGGEPSSYILPTGARTSESAMWLMSHRAEEWVDEQLEQGSTEDYTIITHPDQLQVDVMPSTEFGCDAVIQFMAQCLDQVV